jgi:peptidylprolyl isomerase
MRITELKSVMPKRTIVVASLLVMIVLTACQAAGKNPENVEIPVIQPTPDASLCLNETYPQGAPVFGEVTSDQLVGSDEGIKIFDRATGSGTAPTIQDLVKVNYTSWLPDGCVFDSSYVRGSAAELILVALIPGWREAMLTMTPGTIRRVEIPSSLAYRDIGSPPVIPPNTALIFEIELVSVLTPAEASATATVTAANATATPLPTATPEGGVALPDLSDCDNAGYPDSAPQYGDVTDDQLVAQDSGISVFDLKVGTGRSPDLDALVNIQYTGWLINGCVFDSTYSRGSQATFPVGGVIPGFRDAILGMSIGGQRRVSIPSELGYGQVGAGGLIPPGATLVFDILLESFNAP